MLSPEATVLRGAAIPTAVIAVPMVAGSAVIAGVDGLLGALAGLALVAAFFGVGFLVDKRTRRLAPTAVMGVAMMTYLLKVTLLAVVLVSLKGTKAFNTNAFAIVVITLTVVWLGGEVRAFTKARFRLVEPDPIASAIGASPAPLSEPPAAGAP